MRPAAIRTRRFRNPLDSPSARVVFAGRPQEYKANRLAYPHQVLSERDPQFRQSWERLKKDYSNGLINEQQSEQKFFREVASSLARRRATYH